MKKTLLTSALLSLTLLSAFAGNTQYFYQDASKLIKGSQEVRMNKDDSRIEFVKFSSENAPTFEGFLQWLQMEIKLSADFHLLEKSVEKDADGTKHYRYSWTYQQVPFAYQTLLVHVRDGKVLSFNGEIPETPLQVIPGISVSSALTKALGSVNASTYKWQLPEEESQLKAETGNTSATYYPKGELQYINIPEGKFKNQIKLAWMFDVYAHQPLSRQLIFVDAINGEIIFSANRIHEANANGTAVTAYSGTQNITTDYTGSLYRLRETGRGNGIETYNMLTGTNYGSAVDFTDADNYWNNVNAAKDQYATDAHYAAEETYDFYFTRYGRNSIDNNGFALKSYVHYSTNYVNAFWDGSRMTYGDGNTSYSPLTSLDIGGHEITHGLTNFTANLVYQNESGALNESFSDIFGTAIEFYASPSTADWLIGEDIGAAFRSHSNPNAYGDPDTYLGTNWYSGTADNGGVHSNSGVMNYWFYLLSVGASGTNDIGNAFNVTGINIVKAAAIAYRTLTVYLTTNSQYADARFYSIQAATDLFGACSQEVIQTTNAWYAVGVGTPYSSTISISASGPTTFCDGGSVLLQASPSNASGYVWYLNNVAISGANQATYSATESGSFKASANICGTNVTSGVIAVNEVVIQPQISPSGNALSCNGSPIALSTTIPAGYQAQWNRNNTPISAATQNTYSATQSGNYSLTFSPIILQGQNLNNNTSVSIPDNSCPGGSSSITVSGFQGSVNSGSITVTLNATHTWVGDLSVILQAPNGDILGLANQAGSSGDNFTGTVFSDAGTTTLASASAPFTGTFKPWASTFTTCTYTTTKTSFSGIGNGSINPNGTWTIRAIDGAAADVGSILNWSISFPSYSPANPACGPITSAPVQVTIVNYTPVSISSSGSTSFCPGGSVSLTSSYSSGNQWNTGSVNPSIVVNSAGAFTVSHTSAEGCTSSATANTALLAVPTLTVSPAATICPGNSTTLTAGGANSYSWSPPTGLNTTTGSSVIATPAATTTYTVTGTGSNGCQNSAMVAVNVQSCVPSTAISAAYCGRTDYHLSSSIVADLVSGATQYEFQFKDAADVNVVASITQTSRTLNVANVTPALQWNTQYNVRVRAIIGAQSGTFGVPCIIGFIQNPAITNPTTQLRSTDCNKMNCLLTTSIQANQVAGASQYIFEFRDLSNNLVATRSIANYYTTLSAVTPALQWNTTYNVRVRVNIGTWQGAYGNVCQVGILQDPALQPVPLTQLSTATCGNTALGLNQSGSALAVSGASQYEFEFRNPTTSVVVATHIQASATITWMNVVPALQWGTQYLVKVRAYVGTRVAEWGTSCLIGFIQDPNQTGIGNTSLVASSCTNQNLSQTGTITCTAVAGANQYEFEFKTLTGTTYTNRISTTTTCALSTLTPLLNWGTQYKVRVRAAISGIWGQFSSECTIGLVQDPAIVGVPNTQLRTTDCGRTNLTLSSTIMANAVAGAGSYEFEFQDNSTPGIVYATRTQTSNSLSLSVITPALQTTSQYQVRVRAKIGNVWGNFSTTCLIGFASGARYENTEEADVMTQNLSEEFMVLPNPSADFFRINNIYSSANVTYHVFDLAGKLIENGVMSAAGQNEFGQNYAPGLYLMRLRHPSGSIQNIKIIKN